MNSNIKKSFSQLYKKPCWNIQQGIGSFITFEFGQPILYIGKIYKSRNKSKRLAYVHGEWHLWIYCCDWKYFRDNQLVAHSESSRREIKKAISDLNGQALLDVSLIEKNTVFQFDLGGKLETYPSNMYDDKGVTQWYLYLPNKKVVSFNANGKLAQESSGE